MSEKPVAVCSRDECREHFKSLGLSYDDITDGDILALVLILNREIKMANKSGETSVNTMRLSSKMVIKHKPDGTISECYLYLNSHYFTRRECISFNKDGFIGLCGWADIGNSNPVKRAFLQWADDLYAQKLKNEKEVTKDGN